MNFVKKWMNCIISFIAGVCGLALSACSGMKIATSIDVSKVVPGAEAASQNKLVKAFKVLTDGDLYTQAKQLGVKTEFVWMKAFAIITLVISALLIIYALVMLLKNLNVIKFESKLFDIVGIALISLFLVVVVGLFISSNCYANAMEDALLNISKLSVLSMGIPEAALPNVAFDISAKLGVYQPTMLAIAIISFVVVSVFAFIKRKEA